MNNLTVVVSEELEKQLRESDAWTEAYRVALSFLMEVVIYGSSAFDGGPWQGVTSPLHGGDGGGYAKWFCDCHSESKHTKELFEEAHRMEAHVSLSGGASGSLMLVIKAYKEGATELFRAENWYFPRENAQHKVVNPKAS